MDCLNLGKIKLFDTEQVYTIQTLIFRNDVFRSHDIWFPLSSVQFLSHVQLFVTPWTAECQASLSITNSQSLLKFMPIELVTQSNHPILCHPLLLRVFSDESVLCIRWPNYWSFSLNISPSNDYSGLMNMVQLSSVTQLCLTLCNPMNCSTPDLPVHHQLSELTQTHVH